MREPPKRVIQKAPGKPDHFTKAEAVAAIKKVVGERERAERERPPAACRGAS